MKKDNGKKAILMIASSLIMIASAGCGKEKVKYVEDETTTSTENTTIYEVDTGAVNNSYEEVWEATGVGNNNIIDATVTMSDNTEFKIFEATKNYFDSEETEKFIKSITNDVVYKYDIEDYPKYMLEELMEECNETIAYYESEGLDENEYYHLYDDQYTKLNEYTELYGSASTDLIEATEFDASTYLINYNGISYSLCMGKEYDYGNKIVMTPTEEYEYIWGKEQENTVYSVEKEGSVAENPENMCTITKEEAENQAVEFVENLQIDGMKLTETKPAYITAYNEKDDTYDYWYNGYVMTFGREVDGSLIKKSDYVYKYGTDIENLYYEQCYEWYSDFHENYYFYYGYGIETMYVVVNDNGIVYFSYEYPLTIGSVMAENINTISLDSVKQIMMEEIETKEYYQNKKFTACELRYFPVKDEEDKDLIAIMPVWVLHDTYSTTMVVVSAVDGKVINMGYQLYNPYSYWETVDFDY